MCVKMEIFNRRRLHLLMKHYLRTGVVLTPTIVNQQEPIIRGNVLALAIILCVKYTVCQVILKHEMWNM